MKTPEEWPTEEMKKAAEAYFYSSCVAATGKAQSNEYRLPPTFKWKEVLEIMLAAAPTPPAQKELKVEFTKEWCMKMAQLEGDSAIGAGAPEQEAQWQQAVLNECMSIEGCYKESDPARTVKCLIDWHVANERDSTPAQEDEPYGYLYENDHGSPVFDYVSSEWDAVRSTEVKLYTRPDNSELRKAAKRMVSYFDDGSEPDLTKFVALIDSLRNALEGK